MQNSIEFQLHHWEIPQLSPYYQPVWLCMPGTYSQAPRIFFENFEEDQKVIESVQGDVEVYQKILTNSLRYFQN